MSPALPCALALVAYVLGYSVYARFLAQRVFALDDGRITPAHTLEDGVDYVPTKRAVLYGHHFASITGLAPMLGPAVAVIWGWVPAMIWVVCGAILVGCVHDLGSLVVSMRARGMSMGKVAEGVIGPRAKTLLHLIIFFGIALAMGVFVFVIAKLFSIRLGGPGSPAGYPQSVLPSGGLMLLALSMGWLTVKRGWRLGPLAAVGFVLQLWLVYAGVQWPTLGLDASLWPSSTTWTWLLLVYALAACVLPVWTLLQPRDFLNSLLLYLGLGLSYVGFFVLAPSFAAPAVVLEPAGAPSLFPFVFIVIACGAASGFHSLVASGTTAKQIAKESHARFIGYGGMVGESLLGLLAVLACTAGFAGPELWHGHYGSWASATAGLAGKIGAFISGCSRFLGALGVPEVLGTSFIATIVVSFALTTLDSATRLLRFNLEEIGETLGLSLAKNRFITSAVAVAVIAWFAFYEVGGKPAALALWTLFGTVNQLLAALALLVITLYLRQRSRAWIFTAVPMVFVCLTTLYAMSQHIVGFWAKGQFLLLAVDSVLLALALWLLVEAVLCWRSNRRVTTLDVFVGPD